MQLPCFVLLQDCWMANWAFSWPNPLAASLAWEGLEAHNMELLLEFFHAEGLAIRMKVPPGVVGVHHHNRDCCEHRRQPPSAIGFATSNRWANVPATVPRSRSGHGKFRPLHKAILCRSFNEKLAKDSDLLGPITPFIWANYNDLSRGHLKWCGFGKVNPFEIWPFLGIPC